MPFSRLFFQDFDSFLEFKTLTFYLFPPPDESEDDEDGDSDEGEGGGIKGNPCKGFEFDADCPVDVCQFCAEQEKCKKGQATCDDGSAGVRGNPCKDATELESCGNIQGCLWCEDNSKCKKDSDGCEEEGNNKSIISIDFWQLFGI